MWQNASDCCYEWDEAKSYCQNLNWGGYSDWRLPTISELRSLIRGCSDTETGGSCGVTDTCLHSLCWDPSCDGCSYYGGPAHGKYSPSQLKGKYVGNWSSSTVEDHDDTAWWVEFDKGSVPKVNNDNYLLEGHVRCGRDDGDVTDDDEDDDEDSNDEFYEDCIEFWMECVDSNEWDAKVSCNWDDQPNDCMKAAYKKFNQCMVDEFVECNGGLSSEYWDAYDKCAIIREQDIQDCEK